METQNSSYSRNKKVVQIAIGCLVFGLLALVILAIVYFAKDNGSGGKVPKTPTPTPTVLVDTVVPTPIIEVNNSASVFYILNESNKQPGSLMKYDPNISNSVEKTIDSKKIYLQLLEISNDNSYLAYVNNSSNISFLDLKTLGSSFTDEVYGDDDEFYWLDNNKFALVLEDSIKIFDPAKGDLIETKSFNFPTESSIISASVDLKWILAKEDTRLLRTFLFNTETSKITYLELYDLDDKVAFNYLNWLYPDKLVFFNSIGLSSLNPSNMIQSKMLSLNIFVEEANRLSKLKQSASGYNYYILFDGKFFQYSKDILLAKQILDLNNYQFYNHIDFGISPNEKFASFDRRNGSAIVVNLKTLVSYPLCDLNCYYPVWEK